jgi:hypothetical protein
MGEYMGEKAETAPKFAISTASVYVFDGILKTVLGQKLQK